MAICFIGKNHTILLTLICFHLFYHSLSTAVIRSHSLYHWLSLVVIRCTSHCHSLSLVVPLVVVTRCTTRLSFSKRSFSVIRFRKQTHERFKVMKLNARIRSSHQRCSIKKGVLKNFTIFTGKYLSCSLFFIKFASLQYRCFPVNFTKFLRTPI